MLYNALNVVFFCVVPYLSMCFIFFRAYYWYTERVKNLNQPRLAYIEKMKNNRIFN